MIKKIKQNAINITIDSVILIACGFLSVKICLILVN